MPSYPAMMVSVVLAAGAVGTCGRARGPDPVQPPAVAQEADAHASVRLVLSKATVKPGGTVDLGVSFRIRPGWHIYWNGRNDTGTPPRVKLTLPAGVEAGETLWPAPTRHVMAGDILDHIYEGEVTLIVPLKVGAAAAPGSSMKIAADVDWLVCERVCVPESGQGTAMLTVAEAGQEEKPGETKPIKAARERLPVPPPHGALTMSKTDDRAGREFVLSGAPGTEAMEFYPREDCVALEAVIASTRVAGRALRLKQDMTQPSSSKELTGVVGVWSKGRTTPAYYLVDFGRTP